MTDEAQIPANEVPAQDDAAEGQPTELEVLKNRARLMGIPFSNNISLATLKQKVADKMAEDEAGDAGDDGDDDDDDEQEAASTPAPAKAPKLNPVQQMRQDLMKEQMKLVRVRIACMNPQKANLPGELITVGNKYLGTVSKFVPFGEATDNGYHLEYILYKALEERRFTHITTVKNKQNGQLQTKTRDMKEFSIEILPPLTAEELADLKTAQIAAGSIEGTDESLVLS